MIGIRLRLENRERATVSPTTSPATTEIAKATASSQAVIRSAAGTPLVLNRSPSEATIRDGGLRKVGSIHQRAATSQSKNRAAITASRDSPGWRITTRLICATSVIGAWPGVRAN